MENTRLIMLEGLPGTGKSTNSHFLLMQLERAGKAARWIHEVAHPHPVLMFGEAILTYAEYDVLLTACPQAGPVLERLAVPRQSTVGIDLLEIERHHLQAIGTQAWDALRQYDAWDFPLDRYAAAALDKWAYFTANALAGGDEVYIMDGCLLQYQIFTYLLKNAPYEALEAFVARLLHIIGPLRPALVYFYRESAQATVDFLESLRGTEFMERIWDRDKAESYYRDKPAGAAGQRLFLLDYAGVAGRLFDAADCRKKAIEITDQDWAAHEDALLSFAGAARRPYHGAPPPRGVFRNEAAGLTIKIDGLRMEDPNGSGRALTPKADCEYYVQCLPAVLRFDGTDRLVIGGGQIRERWTVSGTVFERVEGA